MKKKKENPGYVGAVKFWAWQSRGVSAAAQFIVMSGFIAIYCTSMLGMNAAIVGILLAASKVIDAVTDLFAGYLVDRTETKMGKGRPYELAIIGLWLCTWLVFSVPEGMGMTLKYIWVMVFYIAAQSVCSTLLSANQNAYMIRAFNRNEQRVKLASFGGVVIMIGSMAVNIIFPMLQKQIATNLQGWSKVVGMFAVVFGVLGILRFIFVKEENRDEVEKTEKIHLSDVAKVLKHNKYVYMISFMWLIYSLVTGMGAGTYFYTYIVGDISVMGTMSALSIVVLPLLFFFPAIMKKVPMGKLVIIGCIAYIVNGIMMFIAGANLGIIAAAMIVAGIASLPITYLTDLLMIDCGTYNEYVNGQRMDGVIGAVKGFAGKVGSALGSAVLGILLSMGGFISTQSGQVAEQPESALLMIRVAIGIVPAVLFLIVLIMMHFYTLDKKVAEIAKEKEQGKL